MSRLTTPTGRSATCLRRLARSRPSRRTNTLTPWHMRRRYIARQASTASTRLWLNKQGRTSVTDADFAWISSRLIGLLASLTEGTSPTVRRDRLHLHLLQTLPAVALGRYPHSTQAAVTYGALAAGLWTLRPRRGQCAEGQVQLKFVRQ
jgi:hypothetical protein